MEFSINMKLQIRAALWILLTAQLVYLNHQNLCSDSLHQILSYWLDRKFAKRMGNKVFILCNANVQLN